MSWCPVLKLNGAVPLQASIADIACCFNDKKEAIFWLAFLITGDKAQAEACVITAYEMTLQCEAPFRDWVFEWAKSATVRGAIRMRLDEIRRWQSGYKYSHCEHPEHLFRETVAEQQLMAESIWRLDPGLVVAELDPFARAILVLRGILHASVRDCAVLLNVFRESVVAAQCQIGTWLSTIRKDQQFELQYPV